jgi:hypothetical protein
MMGRRRKYLLVNVKETRGYLKLKEEALDRTRRGTRCGRGYGTVLRQTTRRIHDVHGILCALQRGQSIPGFDYEYEKGALCPCCLKLDIKMGSVEGVS